MIVPVLIASALLARSVYGAAYIGCLDPSSVTGGSAVEMTSGLSLSGCLAECSSQSYSHGFYDASLSSCYCDNTEGSGANFIEASDSGGSCNSGEISAYYISTPFGFEVCASSTGSNGDTLTIFVNSAQECFSECTPYGGAIFIRYNAQYFCQCAVGFRPGTSINCQAASAVQGVYVYTQALDPEPSPELSRRRLKEKVRLARQLKNQHCPVGLTACLLNSDSDAFECIDTRSDLESCGGCTVGLYGASHNRTARGQNCEDLKGVAMGAVTCTRGQCEVSACKYGYALVNNECVRMH
ncbi:hypothetical protein IAU59_002697 [Kwoniella sp. CBS 9459]